MTEAYTAGGDAWQTCRFPERGGQTFRPIKTHTLYYVDLQLKGDVFVGQIVVQIYNADTRHKPKDDMISDSYGYLPAPLYPFIPTRCRIKMRPVELVEGEYYCIVLHSVGSLPYTPIQWRFDTAEAEYWRGMRIFSADGGGTWTVYPGSDFIFTEFGCPPGLPVPIKPPVEKFVPTFFDHTAFDTGVCIGLATNSPVHLTLYVTSQEPRKHPVTRYVRGIDVPWYTYFCFVSWIPVEQREAGDTLYHSFAVPNWPTGDKRWMVARGDVNDVISPSVTPVFSLVNTGYSADFKRVRPIFKGDECHIRWTNYLRCPDHYQAVNDIVPLDDARMVWAGDPNDTGQFLDLYIPTRPLCGVGNLDHVTLKYRCRGHGRYPFQGQGKPAVKIGGSVFYGSWWLQGNDTWTNFSHTWNTNPLTGSPWTWDDMNNWQIGMELSGDWRSGYHRHSFFTQLYADLFF